MQMKLVVDANELFNGIIEEEELRDKVLYILFSDKVEFFAPFRLYAELEKNREWLRRLSGFSHRDFEVFVRILKARITKFIPLEMFLDKLPEAKKISPHPKDLQYFALALKLDSGLWSNEKGFKEQNKIPVFNTEELFEKLKRMEEESES